MLERGKAVGAKPLKEYLEVKGYGDAAQWVYAQALEPGNWRGGGLVAVQELCHIHKVAMDPVWQVAPHPDATDRESPGNFREHNLRFFGGGMTPPTWPLVEAEVRGWVDAVNDQEWGLLGAGQPTPAPERLAQIHNHFERVHPFIDGNGRTGRLVLNLLLVRLGYPPIVILKQQRSAYLRALQKADLDDVGSLGELLARDDNLNRFIVTSLAGPARLVPLATLVDGEFTIAALRRRRNAGGSTLCKDPTACGAARARPSIIIGGSGGPGRAERNAHGSHY